MKKLLTEKTHSQLNQGTIYLLKELCNQNITYEFKLNTLIKERNVSIRKLATLTGLRATTLSDIANGKKSTINMSHIIVIMWVLKITDLSDLISIYIPEQLKFEMDIDQKEWIETKKIPNSVIETSLEVARYNF